jgi:hypothetical protein
MYLRRVVAAKKSHLKNTISFTTNICYKEIQIE